MAGEIDTLLDELYEMVTNLEEQGLVDIQFITNYEMKPEVGSTFFLELVRRFHQDIQNAMRDLALALEHFAVDYTEIREHHAIIKRIIRGFGASALNLPLEMLRLGVAASSKEECDFALLRMHQENHKLRQHLESITELERRIVDLDGNLARLGNN